MLPPPTSISAWLWPLAITIGWMFWPSCEPACSVGDTLFSPWTRLLCTSYGVRHPASSVSFLWVPHVCAGTVPATSPSPPSSRTSSRWFCANPTAPPRRPSAPAGPLRASAARAFLFSRLDGVSQRRPSDSKSISAGPPRSPRTPTAKRRRRRWATPKNCASRTRHPIPYRSPPAPLMPAISRRKHSKSPPPELLSAPGTFSQTQYRGMISDTARTYSNMSPEAPSRPSLFPATEKLWQGEPPTTASTGPCSEITFFQSTLVMSPMFGTSGNLAARTADGNSSISQKQTGSHPSGPAATLAASMPLNRLTYLNSSPRPSGPPA